jgi:hypothetical protein
MSAGQRGSGAARNDFKTMHYGEMAPLHRVAAPLPRCPAAPLSFFHWSSTMVAGAEEVPEESPSSIGWTAR